MKAPAILFCALLVANGLPAQNYSIIIRQAKEAASGGGGGGNNAPQNPSPPPSTPPPQNNPPPNPALEATLRNIANLRVDFDALGKLTGLKPDSLPQKMLLNDLATASQDTKPPDASISSLAGNLATAIAGKEAMQPRHAKLAQDIHAIFNSSHLSPAQQQAVFDDVQKILQDGGASADDVINVVSDIRTIATETR